MFWACVEAFTSAERSQMLKFATGRIRLPVKLKVESLSECVIIPLRILHTRMVQLIYLLCVARRDPAECSTRLDCLATVCCPAKLKPDKHMILL